MSKTSEFPLEFIPVKTGAGMTFLEMALKMNLKWSPTGKARGTSVRYPPTPMGAETLRYASARAWAGYPPVAKSAVALT
jgi:hypothetical protein